MKRTLLLLLTTIFISNLSYSQIANGPNENLICDNFGANDGIGIFDLSNSDFAILGSQNPSNFTVTYHISQSDADNNINALQNDFINTTNPQTIYGRLTDNTSGNYDTTTIELIVDLLPIYNLEETYEICNDGSSITIDTNLNQVEYIFEWSLDGTVLPETTSSLVVNQAGIYVVTVYDINGCGALSTAFLVNQIDCTDTDSDGVIDIDEDINSNGDLTDDDTDMDNVANYLDEDDDGDNVPTIIEINIVTGRSANQMHAFVDTDNDLIENYLDNDDDGDNVLTINEDYNNNGDPTDDDTDNSGTPDYLEMGVALSINNFDINSIKLFPNPSNDLVTIQTSNQIANISVYDIQGKQIKLKTESSSFAEITFSVKNLENGIYFVKVGNGLKEKVLKLIVE